MHEIAGNHCTHAFRGTGKDQITGLELKKPREEGDGFGNAPDHLRNVARLAPLAVHVERDGCGDKRGAVMRAVDRAHRGRAVERLADFPWPALLIGLSLQVASGHVVPYRLDV